MIINLSQEQFQALTEGRKTHLRKPVRPGEYTMPDFSAVMTQTGLIKWQVGHEYAVRSSEDDSQTAFIRITSIWREQLQEITGFAARDEGVCPLYEWQYIKAFAEMWDTLYPRKGTRWADNPLVWVLTFEAVR